MSLAQLQSQIQSQVAAGQAFAVSAATVSSAGLTPTASFDDAIQGQLLLTAALSVAFTGTVPDPSGSTLTVSGTADLLGMAGVTVVVAFVVDADDSVDALLTITASSTWDLAQAFPLLSGGAFAAFTIAGASLILATSAGMAAPSVWPEAAGSLPAGLSITATLTLSGDISTAIAGLFTSSLPTALSVYGTIDSVGTSQDPAPSGMPLVDLTVALDAVTMSLGDNCTFAIGGPSLALTSALAAPAGGGTSAATVAYAFGLSCTMVYTATTGGSTTVGTLTAALSSQRMTLALTPSSTGLSVAQIKGLLGFSYAVPSTLQDAFSGYDLTAFAITVALPSVSVTSIKAGLTATSPWTFGSCQISSPALSILALDPWGTASVTLSVEASVSALVGRSSTFSAPFDLRAELGDDPAGTELSVSATYPGETPGETPAPLTVQAVATDLVGSCALPDALAAVTLTSFDLSFAGQDSTTTFTMACTGTDTFPVPLVGGNADADLTVLVDVADESSYRLTGSLTIGGAIFDAAIADQGGDVTLSATWAALSDQTFGVENLIQFLGLDTSWIPASVDLQLQSAGIYYDFEDDTLVLAAASANYGDLALVTQTVAGTRNTYVVVAIDGTFDLSDLPLIGQKLASLETVTVDVLAISLSSGAPLTADICATLNTLVKTGFPDQACPQFQASSSNVANAIQATITFGDDAWTVAFSIGGEMGGGAGDGDGAAADGAGTTAAGGQNTQVKATTAQDGTEWFAVQKSFGPVTLQRIGVSFDSTTSSIQFALDASLALGPLNLDLTGLGFGSPITTFAPTFSLSGLGVTYSAPPLTIGGALVNLSQDGLPEFEGALTVGAEDFTLQVFGFYGQVAGAQGADYTSMFVYGDIAHDLGGPPAFFVTGLALGFGYNSAIAIPTVDQVATFPFISVLPRSSLPNPKSPGGPGADPAIVLASMNSYVTPQDSSLWFAAGITFTSFQLVNSQALALVDVGSELTVALLGTSSATFPQGETEVQYANIDVDILVRLVPSQGVFSLEAVLASGSFVIDPACVLTGGLAFYVWFGDNPNAGDFVLTLGGYNPAFTPPSYYPSVPALGFHWTVDSSITIQGSAYFALTPAALMFGGALQATYQSGNLQAWFDAHADAVIQWNPFSFDLDIGVTIGASYTIDILGCSITLSVELGCDIQLWGPPTSGIVTASWSVISISIPFGATTSPSHTPSLTAWSQVEAMLPNTAPSTAPSAAAMGDMVRAAAAQAGHPVEGPADSAGAEPAAAPSSPNVLTIAAVAGLVPAGTAGGSDPQDTWVVRPGTFAFRTSSAVPATTATAGEYDLLAATQTFSVAPLGWTSVTATHSLVIRDGTGKDVSDSLFTSENLAATPVVSSVPVSLWGTPPAGGGQLSVPSAQGLTLPGLITGLSFQVCSPQLGVSPGPIAAATMLADVQVENGLVAALPLSAPPPTTGDQPAVNTGQVVSAICSTENGIGTASTAAARSAIFAALGELGYGPTTDDGMGAFMLAASTSFPVEPLICSVEPQIVS